MKINHLDAHDRLLQFKKQEDLISKGCQDCISNRPQAYGKYPFYIFAHTRTADDGVTKRLLWEPRLTKPKSQSNSMLFRYYPVEDIVKIIWIIPARELWKQYEKDKLCENNTIFQSISDFVYNRNKLDAPDSDELPDEIILCIMKEVGREAQQKKKIQSLIKEINA